MSTSLTTEPDHCPRCGGTFACGADGPEPCACSAIELSAALLLQLRRQFSGCLCLNCLRELAAQETPATPS